MMIGARAVATRIGRSFAWTTVLAVALTLLALRLAAQSPQQPPRGQGPAPTEQGFGLFQQRCLGCHGNPAFENAPAPAALREMSPERILDALTNGVMKSIGDTLTEEQRRLVSESVAGRLLGTSALGDAASMPVQSFIKHFGSEFEYHIENKKCLVPPEVQYQGSQIYVSP